MTKEEMQELLDSILIPLKKFNKSINANEKLSETDEDTLYQIVFDEEANKLDIDKAVVDIAEIMKKFEVDKSTRKPLMNTDGTPMLTKEGNQKYAPAKAVVMPFLIKQVLFYLSCRYISKGVAQKDFIKELQSNGVSISHNFFSRLGLTPEYYIKVKTYNQPKCPMNYLGQKHEELGAAIRNLVYQAGSHTHFVDIFGGSGGASVAVCHKDNVAYAYNEKNRTVCNLMQVLADDTLYLELIEAIERLKKDLIGKEPYIDMDISAEIKAYQSRKKGNRVIKELRIDKENGLDFDVCYDSIMDFMANFHKSVVNQPADFSFDLDGYLVTRDDLLQIHGFMGYIMDFKCVKAYSLNFMNSFDNINFLTNDKLIKESDAERGEKSKKTILKKGFVKKYKKDKDFIQYRFYKYFCYFDNLLKTQGKIQNKDKIPYALGLLFTGRLLTQGSTGVSAILRMHMSSDGANNKSNDAMNFLTWDATGEIIEFHNTIKKLIVHQDDFLDIINLYKDSNTLFYSDSPYISTKDYKSDVNGVSAFTSGSMINLIDALFRSGRKFIFSCRATTSGTVTDKEKKESIKRSSNENIAQSVFLPLLDYSEENKVPLYVLAIEKKDKLDTLINDNEVSELMITNFEIKSFSDSEFKNVSYKVYSYIDFLELHINNAKVTNKTTKKIEKLKEQGKL